MCVASRANASSSAGGSAEMPKIAIRAGSAAVLASGATLAQMRARCAPGSRATSRRHSAACQCVSSPRSQAAIQSGR